MYVHVPFCARRCSYCDFAIAVRKRVPAGRYLSALLRELSLRRDRGEWDDGPPETLYLGGGTPSLLPSERLAELIPPLMGRAVGGRVGGPPASGFPAPPDGAAAPPAPEVTLEANPDDVTGAVARAWRQAGVNRVSLGAQSFHPAVLRWMHRTHDAGAVPRAVHTLRDAGVTEISLDLIFGLPEELGADFAADLGEALALAPEHVSVYGLSVEPRTPLARWISRGAATSPSDDRYVDEFLLAHETLTRAGFEHYEVSNYARPGHRSRHNSAYWTARPYAGLGPAAHSYRPAVSPHPEGERATEGARHHPGGEGAGEGAQAAERRWNLSQWAAYEEAASRGVDPTESRELLTPAQARVERLYLGLRTSAGVGAADWSLPPDTEAAWVSEGWLLREQGRYRLTPSGWLKLDALASVLTTSADSG